MTSSIQKMRNFYAITPDTPIYQKEFGFFCLDRWIEEGHLKPNDGSATYGDYFDRLFMYDEPAVFSLAGLGWCEGGFSPAFPEAVLEDRGDYEVVQDFAGRHLLCFKGRRRGFMPEYLDHPVKDMYTWEKDVKWRMSPDNAERYLDFEASMTTANEAAAEGLPIVQRCVGGYMYLRSLIGPLQVSYMFYDNPALIHDCMKTWFELADAVIAKNQERITLDEFFIGEDICYNHGPLISPDMIKEFLFPYYEQLLTNMKKRQLDKSRTLHFQLDTDGFCEPVIDLYRSIGMDYISPLEVAAGCDVVRVAQKYPDMRVSGGIDKRILAAGKDAIDRELERIMPAMRHRGGYIPTCDHGVPEEVSFENYMHYRERMQLYCI